MTQLTHSSNTFDNGPVTNEEAERGVVDWAESITKINLSMRALSEAIANKDKARSAAECSKLTAASFQMKEYLSQRGVFEPLPVEAPPAAEVVPEVVVESKTEASNADAGNA